MKTTVFAGRLVTNKILFYLIMTISCLAFMVLGGMLAGRPEHFNLIWSVPLGGIGFLLFVELLYKEEEKVHKEWDNKIYEGTGHD